MTLLVKRLKQLCNHAASLENRDEIGSMMDQAKKLEEQNKTLEEEEEVWAFARINVFSSSFY